MTAEALFPLASGDIAITSDDCYTARAGGPDNGSGPAITSTKEIDMPQDDHQDDHGPSVLAAVTESLREDHPEPVRCPGCGHRAHQARKCRTVGLCRCGQTTASS